MSSTALAPLNDPTTLKPLHDAGVGEVYAGFHDPAWELRFGNAELNRMSGFGREANPFSFDQLCEQTLRAHGLGMKAFVCFNAPSYTPEQANFIERHYLQRLAAAKAHGVILSGQALARTSREVGLAVTMSTVAGIYNAPLARHYQQRGATRVILPRDLSIGEITRIVCEVPNLEYEVFLMRNGCLFSDSHCLGQHRAGRPSLCTSLRMGANTLIDLAFSDNAQNAFETRARENERVLNECYHRRTCGLCALWRFEQLGVDAYKVVGRGDDPTDLCADAALVMRNAAFARTCATEADYLAGVQRPRDPQTLCGMQGLSCYYPEISRKRL